MMLVKFLSYLLLVILVYAQTICLARETKIPLKYANGKVEPQDPQESSQFHGEKSVMLNTKNSELTLPWKVIGHRGSPGEEPGFPENSLEGFKHCVNSGFGFELDIRLTAIDPTDGKYGLVIAHDNELEVLEPSAQGKYQRTTVDVSRTSYHELTKLTLANGKTILSLSDILAKIPKEKTVIYAELKGSSNFDVSKNQARNKILVDAAAALVVKEGWENHVVFSSFDRNILAYLKSHPTAEVRAIKRAYLWEPLNGQKPGKIDWKQFLTQELDELGCTVFQPPIDYVDEALVNLIKGTPGERAILIPWVYMDPKETLVQWGNLYKLGVDGLCTNTPIQFAQWLWEKEQSVPSEKLASVKKTEAPLL